MTSAPRSYARWSREWTWRALCVGYFSLLVALPILDAWLWGFTQFSLWQLQNTEQFRDWIAWVGWSVLFDTLRFVLLGFLVARALSGTIPLGRTWRLVRVVILPSGLALGAHSIETNLVWQIPRPLFLLFPLAGSILGAWLVDGTFSCRPKRCNLGWVIPLVLGGTCGAGIVVALLATESKPLEFEPVRVTSADKRHLVGLFRGKDPRRLEVDEIQSISLTAGDINRLLAWGLSIGSRERKARVDLDDGRAELLASLALPYSAGRSRYVNLSASGRAEIVSGKVEISEAHIRAGRLVFPKWMARFLCFELVRLLEKDQHARSLLTAIDSLKISPHDVTVLYHRADLPDGFVSDVLNRLGPGDDLLPRSRVYARHLISVRERLPEGDDRFGACLQEVFRLARERSRDSDPVLENRAVIISLATILGHRRIQSLTGYVLDEGTPWESLRGFSNVTLRGRSDWTKHFWVSAGLALISTGATSDAVGLLKEELDAGRGGSGFSFADLLADRAGTTFALAATHDELAARRMQERLATSFRLDDYFPPAADLPEDIPDALLTEKYGGVGGRRYLELTNEIERRVADCAAYRNSR